MTLVFKKWFASQNKNDGTKTGLVLVSVSDSEEALKEIRKRMPKAMMESEVSVVTKDFRNKKKAFFIMDEKVIAKGIMR